MVDGVPSEKVSTLSFVDLAGTDRRHAKVGNNSSQTTYEYAVFNNMQ